MLRLTPNFTLIEFVPKEVYDKFGDSSIWFFDPRLPKIAQFIHDRYNTPIIINGVYNGQVYNYSCLRTPDSNEFKPLSQHTGGKAIDVKGVNSKVLRQDIIDNFTTIWKPLGITTIEKNTSTWTHIDLRYTGLDTLLQVEG